MPRHIFKRFMLDENKIKKHPFLCKLGLQDPNLWHLNRKSVSVAFLVGVFFAFMPMPLQMLAAAVAAVIIRCNLPLAVGLVWISNPLTIPPIFFFCYQVGALLMGTEMAHESAHFSVEWIADSLSQIWAPLLVGSLACGLFFSISSFFLVRLFWVLHVANSWKARCENRRLKKEQKKEVKNSQTEAKSD